MQNIESTALAFFTAIRGYVWILVVAGLLAVGGIALWGKQSWKDAVKRPYGWYYHRRCCNAGCCGNREMGL